MIGAGHAHTGDLGLAVWTLIAHGWGARLALLALALMMFAGYGAGGAMAWFQAFVAGSILHVIIYESGHQHAGDEVVTKWPDRFGLLWGLALLHIYL